jgi:Sulfatase
VSAAGPFDRWPTGLGFEYFYGFLAADTDQWAPTLVENTTPVQPPSHDPSYILDRDLADHAINWLHQQHSLAPSKPFFLYYASGSTRSPNQAPADWIARFKGKFAQGWDKVREESFARQKALGVIPKDARLTPRPPELPAADVDVPAGADGVLLAQGGQFAGYSFYLKNGRLAFCYNTIPPRLYTVRSDQTVSPGHHVLVTDFESDDPHPGSGGWVTLKIDGQPVARGHVEHTLPRMGWTEGLDVGRDLITAVSDDYAVPDVFTGVIRTVTVNVK